MLLNIGNIFFLDMIQKHNKSKNKQKVHHQTENLLHSKGNHQQNEKAVYKFGENFLNCLSKGLISKIYRGRILLNSKQKEIPIKKWAEDPNIDFSKEDTKRTNRYMKRRSTSLFSREIQIETTMRYQFISVRMTAIKKTRDNKCWWRCGKKKKELLCIIS